MLALLLPILASAASITPTVGVEWQPFSRADLTWVDSELQSGMTVGEFDGFVNPALGAYGGVWIADQFAVLGSLGVAHLQNTSYSGDVFREQSWAVIRPAVDFRVAFLKRQPHVPSPWFFVGTFTDLAVIADVSNGYTESETESASQSADEDQNKLTGLGVRGGIGVDMHLTKHISLGVLYGISWYTNRLVEDPGHSTSSWLTSRAAILLAFEWPTPEKDSGDSKPVK
jgi:hypothetical protein